MTAPSSPDKSNQTMRAELLRLQEWFKDRDDRPGHKSQIIHIGMALDAADREAAPNAVAPRPLNGEACDRIYREAYKVARAEKDDDHYILHGTALVHVYAAGQRSALSHVQHNGPCPDGDACPDAKKYGSVHPAPVSSKGLNARLHEELRRLRQWFADREERSGHKAQMIYIDGVLAIADSVPSATQHNADTARLNWMQDNLPLIRDLGWLAGQDLRDAIDRKSHG